METLLCNKQFLINNLFNLAKEECNYHGIFERIAWLGCYVVVFGRQSVERLGQKLFQVVKMRNYLQTVKSIPVQCLSIKYRSLQFFKLIYTTLDSNKMMRFYSLAFRYQSTFTLLPKVEQIFLFWKKTDEESE